MKPLQALQVALSGSPTFQKNASAGAIKPDRILQAHVVLADRMRKVAAWLQEKEADNIWAPVLRRSADLVAKGIPARVAVLEDLGRSQKLAAMVIPTVDALAIDIFNECVAKSYQKKVAALAQKKAAAVNLAMLNKSAGIGGSILRGLSGAGTKLRRRLRSLGEDVRKAPKRFVGTLAAGGLLYSGSLDPISEQLGHDPNMVNPVAAAYFAPPVNPNTEFQKTIPSNKVAPWYKQPGQFMSEWANEYRKANNDATYNVRLGRPRLSDIPSGVIGLALRPLRNLDQPSYLKSHVTDTEQSRLLGYVNGKRTVGGHTARMYTTDPSIQNDAVYDGIKHNPLLRLLPINHTIGNFY